VFIRIEAGRDAALVPLPMFAIRPFRGAVAATAGMTFGMYGMLFLLPLVWLSRGVLDPVAAGIALTPSAAAFVVTSPFSGRLAERVGARLMMSGGVAIIGCGLILVGVTPSGTVLIGAEAYRRPLGYVFQEASLFPHLSGPSSSRRRSCPGSDRRSGPLGSGSTKPAQSSRRSEDKENTSIGRSFAGGKAFRRSGQPDEPNLGEEGVQALALLRLAGGSAGRQEQSGIDRPRSSP
jgi:hypothetical protein